MLQAKTGMEQLRDHTVLHQRIRGTEIILMAIGQVQVLIDIARVHSGVERVPAIAGRVPKLCVQFKRVVQGQAVQPRFGDQPTVFGTGLFIGYIHEERFVPSVLCRVVRSGPDMVLTGVLVSVNPGGIGKTVLKGKIEIVFLVLGMYEIDQLFVLAPDQIAKFGIGPSGLKNPCVVQRKLESVKLMEAGVPSGLHVGREQQGPYSGPEVPQILGSIGNGIPFGEVVQRRIQQFGACRIEIFIENRNGIRKLVAVLQGILPALFDSVPLIVYFLRVPRLVQHVASLKLPEQILRATDSKRQKKGLGDNKSHP